MEFDWKADLFKFLMGSVLGGGMLRIYVKSKPTIELWRRVIKSPDRLDKVENDVYVNMKRRIAYYDLDDRPIFILNQKREVIYVNYCWLTTFGFSDSKQSLGTGYLRAIPNSDHVNIRNKSKELVGNEGSFDEPITFQHIGTKELIYTNCRSEPIFDLHGILVETIGFLTIIK